jgi:hypothetical protein
LPQVLFVVRALAPARCVLPRSRHEMLGESGVLLLVAALISRA